MHSGRTAVNRQGVEGVTRCAPGPLYATMPATPHHDGALDGAFPVAVVGAGPSGLATAAMLRRAGVPTVLLEHSDRVGTSWRRRYDHLRLHTSRGSSGLPGLAVPRRSGVWVPRDEYVRYLERYVAHHRLEVRVDTPVQRIEPIEKAARAGAAGGRARWRVHTPQGALTARAVVVATGRCHTPWVPDWPGRTAFTGTLLHAAQYQNPGPYRGQEVLVVGAGNSGTEIAAVLGRSGARRVWLAVRTPPNILPRSSSRWQALGQLTDRLPLAWRDRTSLLMERLMVPDLGPYGLPRSTTGLYTRNAVEGVNPVLDHGFVAAVRSGQVQPVAAVAGFDGGQAVLADGSRLTPDTVIAATGYRPNLHSLLDGLDVLDPAGYPTVTGARTAPTAPHLYFAGYTNPLNGVLRQAGVEARGIARALRIEATPAPVPPVPSPRVGDPASEEAHEGRPR